MTISIYSVEELKTKNTLKTELPSIGAAIKFIKSIGKSISECKIVEKSISVANKVENKLLLVSGMSDEDISLVNKGNVLPIYNNPSQVDECESVIVFSENKVLVGKLKSKEEYSVEAAPVWKNVKGKYGYNSWNTNLFFKGSSLVYDRKEFEKNNFKLKGTQGGVGYKNAKLNLLCL